MSLAACANTIPISPAPSPPLASPTPPAVAASPAITCRLSADDCANAIGLVRQLDPLDVVSAHAIVVADVCPPSMACDRLYPFDSLVVLVPLAQTRATAIAFKVTGTNGPERVAAFSQALPAHIAALVAAAGSGLVAAPPSAFPSQAADGVIDNAERAAVVAERLATIAGPWTIGGVQHGTYENLWQGSTNDMSGQGTADRAKKAARIVWRVDLAGPTGLEELYIDEATGQLLDWIIQGS
jgi:hypothetical protein